MAVGAAYFTLRLAHEVPGPAPGVRIHVEYLFYRFGFSCRRFTKYCLNCRRNVLEAQRSVQKRRDGHLVGGIERNRLCPSCLDCLVSQT